MGRRRESLYRTVGRVLEQGLDRLRSAQSEGEGRKPFKNPSGLGVSIGYGKEV